MKRIIFGSDHAGFELKTKLIEKLKLDSDLKEFSISDKGCFSTDSVDYPDLADLVCKELKVADFGVLICGTGQGMCLRANKYSQIRAALVYNAEIAKLAREHNDANIICLGARFIDFELSYECIKIFLKTKFAEGRHRKRVEKLSATTL